VKEVSIRRRPLIGVAVVQIVAAALSTVLVVRHERRQSYSVLDANLSEHAALLKAAIEPPDETNAGVNLHRELLILQPGERYVLRDANGRVVAASSNWLADVPLPDAPRSFINLRIQDRPYRALVLHDLALLNVEPDEVKNLPRLTLIYAVRTRGVEEHIQHVAQIAGATSAGLLLVSLLATSWVVSAGLQPIVQIVERAARIDASNWEQEDRATGPEARELAPISAALTHLVGRLRASFERERRFAADAAHEMKTAVAIVKLTLQLTLDREREAAEYRQGMERALEDTERLQRLVGDMLHLAKIEGLSSDIATSELSSADGVGAAREVVRRLTPLLTARQITITIKQQGEAATVRMTPDELRLVLTNLLENAIYASSDGSTIRITAATEAQECILSIADTGCGITVDALPHVFERFFRGDPSRSRKSGGNGLGLSIVMAMVERIGGSITVTSTLGEGSVFVVRLPMMQQADAPTA
jgi:signal transduction histidine kinase